MEFSDILSLIGSYAFPIVACIALFWKSVQDERLHKEEMKTLSDAVDNNSTLLQKILAYLERS